MIAIATMPSASQASSVVLFVGIALSITSRKRNAGTMPSALEKTMSARTKLRRLRSGPNNRKTRRRFARRTSGSSGRLGLSPTSNVPCLPRALISRPNARAHRRMPQRTPRAREVRRGSHDPRGLVGFHPWRMTTNTARTAGTTTSMVTTRATTTLTLTRMRRTIRSSITTSCRTTRPSASLMSSLRPPRGWRASSPLRLARIASASRSRSRAPRSLWSSSVRRTLRPSRSTAPASWPPSCCRSSSMRRCGRASASRTPTTRTTRF